MSHGCSEMSGGREPPTVDFAYLAAQTFGDRLLERELLDLFLEQSGRHVARMAEAGFTEAGRTAHLLRGSCLGIGAWHAAAAAQAFEDAAPGERPLHYDRMSAAFVATEAAIRLHLASF